MMLSRMVSLTDRRSPWHGHTGHKVLSAPNTLWLTIGHAKGPCDCVRKGLLLSRYSL